jgi:hypothetical protein
LVAENKINFGFNARFGEFKGFKCYSLKKWFLEELIWYVNLENLRGIN